MILGIMQPYFFPYLGYFELIARSDQWVVFDAVQYNPKSWMNRNRILHPKKGWQYLNVPVTKVPRGTAICEIQVKDMNSSLDRITGQLQHYKKKAPFFNQTLGILRESFAKTDSDRLVDLNVSGLEVICNYLGIPFNRFFCTRMDIKRSNIKHPGQWALEIATLLRAKKYINPPGGRKIFNPAEWEQAGIDLEFTEAPQFQYACSPYEFIEHLSILDVLMWNSPETVRTYLKARAGSTSKFSEQD